MFSQVSSGCHVLHLSFKVRLEHSVCLLLVPANCIVLFLQLGTICVISTSNVLLHIVCRMGTRCHENIMVISGSAKCSHDYIHYKFLWYYNTLCVMEGFWVVVFTSPRGNISRAAFDTQDYTTVQNRFRDNWFSLINFVTKKYYLTKDF